jgi:hypothetical protein
MPDLFRGTICLSLAIGFEKIGHVSAYLLPWIACVMR